MMGLNILPDLERDCKSPRHHQLSQEGAPTVCHDTVSENERAQSEMHAVNSAEGYEYCEDFSPKNPGTNVCICGLVTEMWTEIADVLLLVHLYLFKANLI